MSQLSCSQLFFISLKKHNGDTLIGSIVSIVLSQLPRMSQIYVRHVNWDHCLNWLVPKLVMAGRSNINPTEQKAFLSRALIYIIFVDLVLWPRQSIKRSSDIQILKKPYCIWRLIIYNSPGAVRTEAWAETQTVKKQDFNFLISNFGDWRPWLWNLFFRTN